MSALTERAADLAAKFDADHQRARAAVHRDGMPWDDSTETRNDPPKGADGGVTSPEGGKARGGAEPPYPDGVTSYTTPSASGVTRRQPRAFRPRPTEWAPWAPDVFAQLDELGPMVERLYVIGPRPGASVGGVRTWATGPLPLGWEPGGRHYLEGNLPVLRYRRADGRPLAIHRAAAWFGEDPRPEPAEAAAAMAVLGEMIDRHFDGGAILDTPASTGRLLIMRSLGNREYPVLDLDTQELIRTTSGQGRIELMAAPSWADLPAWNPAEPCKMMPALVEYDGRLMYAGCVRELGHGVPVHDGVDEFAGYTRGRYLVRFAVPADWSHVGILGVHDGEGWSWPREPGAEGECWCDASELRVALDHGWRVRIVERLLFPEHRGRPLDKWAETLVKIREGLLHRAAVGSVSLEVAKLAADAVRSIVLHGIGALQGTSYKETMTSPNAADVPSNAGDSWRVDGDVHVWSEDRGQAWAEMAHPELCAQIWGRARARLLHGYTGTDRAPSGALNVDPTTVVAFRTDAIYLTADPRWHDDGAVGRYRRKATVPGPLPWPATTAQLLAIKAVDGEWIAS